MCACVPFVLDNELLKLGSYQRQTWQRLSPFSMSSFCPSRGHWRRVRPSRHTVSKGTNTPSVGSSTAPLPIPGVTHFSVPASYPCPCHEFVSGIPLGKFQSDEGPRDRGLEIIPRDLDSRPCEFRPSLRGTHPSVPKLVHWTLGRLAVETLDPYFHLGLAMAPWTFHLPSPRTPSFLSALVSPPQVPPGRHQCLLYLSSNPSPTETWQIRQPQPHILSQDVLTCRYATPIAPDPRNAGFISSCKSTLVLKISRSTDSQESIRHRDWSAQLKLVAANDATAVTT